MYYSGTPAISIFTATRIYSSLLGGQTQTHSEYSRMHACFFALCRLYFIIYLLSLQQWVTSIDGYLPFWPPAYVTV